MRGRTAIVILATVLVIGLPFGIAYYRQHGKLVEYEHASKLREEFCIYEVGHAATLLKLMETSPPERAAVTARQFARYYEVPAMYAVCLPSVDLNPHDAVDCWDVKEDINCLLPFARRISQELRQRWQR